MATKIFYNDNRIIIDGHADTPQECKAITAMCDELANSENFKTIVYEKGHAVFEQISGGDAMLFAMQDYVLTSKYESEVGADYPTAKGTVAKRLNDLEEQEADCLTKTDAALVYETKAAHEASVTLLQDQVALNKTAINNIEELIVDWNKDLQNIDESAQRALAEISAIKPRITVLEYDIQVLRAAHEASVTSLQDQIALNKTDISSLNTQLDANIANTLAHKIKILAERVSALEGKSTYQLPYTVEQIVEKLGQIETD